MAQPRGEHGEQQDDGAPEDRDREASQDEPDGRQPDLALARATLVEGPLVGQANLLDVLALATLAGRLLASLARELRAVAIAARSRRPASRGVALVLRGLLLVRASRARRRRTGSRL